MVGGYEASGWIQGLETLGAGDVDEGGQARAYGALTVTSIGSVTIEKTEAVGGCSGTGMPLNATISLFLSDACLIVLRIQHLTRTKSETLNIAFNSSVVLQAVSRGS